MSTLQERGGSFGIALEGTPGTAEAAPLYFLTVDDANIMHEPVTYERTNNTGAEVIGVEQAGYDTTWDFSGAELSVEVAGYLLWLMFGSEVNTTGTHAIAPVFNSKEFTVFKDHGGIFESAGGFITQRAVASRFQTLTFEQSLRDYAKWGGSGMARSVSPLASGLSPSLDLSANGAPLSWANLASVSMTFDGGSTIPITTPKSFSFTVEREIEPALISISGATPGAIVEGGRTVTGEITFDLEADAALPSAAYLANLAGHDCTFSASYSVNGGARTLTLGANPARITNSVPGSIGSGTSPQEWTIQFRAYQGALGGPSAPVAIDGNTTDYDAR